MTEEELAEIKRVVTNLLALEYPDDAYTADVPMGAQRSSYGDSVCGCTWDSGPFSVHCADHDPQPRRQAVLEAVPLLLDAIERLRTMLIDAETEAEMQASEVERLLGITASCPRCMEAGS